MDVSTYSTPIRWLWHDGKTVRPSQEVRQPLVRALGHLDFSMISTLLTNKSELTGDRKWQLQWEVIVYCQLLWRYVFIYTHIDSTIPTYLRNFEWWNAVVWPTINSCFVSMVRRTPDPMDISSYKLNTRWNKGICVWGWNDPPPGPVLQVEVIPWDLI